MAWGEGKAPVIKQAVEGEITDADPRDVPAAAHQSPAIVLDTAAAAELTRFKTPWLLGLDGRLRPAVGRATIAQGRDLAGADAQASRC